MTGGSHDPGCVFGFGVSVTDVQHQVYRHHDKIETIKEQNPFVFEDSVGNPTGISDQYEPQKDRTLAARLLRLEHLGNGKWPGDPETEDHQEFKDCDSIRHGHQPVPFASAGSVIVSWFDLSCPLGASRAPQKSGRKLSVNVLYQR
jgi:hypothetical protein